MKRIFIATIILAILIILFGIIPAYSGTRYRRIQVTATAYCPCVICCGSHSDGKTAIGRDANLPGIAVDPRVIPLRSRVDIPGYSRRGTNGSWVKADDTGRLIKGNRIDLRFESHKEAKQYGVRKITIRVWD